MRTVDAPRIHQYMNMRQVFLGGHGQDNGSCLSYDLVLGLTILCNTETPSTFYQISMLDNQDSCLGKKLRVRLGLL